MKKLILPALLPISLLVGGCASLPKYEKPPQVDLGQGWIAPATPPEPTDLQEESPAQLEAWWQSLGDPTLERLIEEALEKNLDLRLAVTRIAEARANYERVVGRKYPVVGARGSITERRQSENGPLPIGQIPGLERDQTLHDLALDASWEIDMYGRYGRTLKASGARLEASEDEAIALRLSVAAEVARVYFGLRGAQRELAAREESIAAQEKTLALVRQRVEAGDLAETELTPPEARIEAAKAARPQIESRIEAAALALGTLLGGLPEQELTLRGAAALEVVLPRIPVGQRADLLRRRPDIRAAERRLAGSTAELGLTMAEKFPKLSISGTGGFEALDLGDLLKAGSQVFSLTPLITWRIFDGGRVQAEIKAAEARQESAALAYENSVLAALGDAERAMSEYRWALETLAAQQKVVAKTEQVHENNLRRYQAGDIAMFEVLEAERQLSEAKEAQVRTETQAASGLVSAFKALGGGWAGE